MVFTCDVVPYGLHTGRYINISRNLAEELKSSMKKKFDFICIPLFHPCLLRNKQSLLLRKDPMAKSG